MKKPQCPQCGDSHDMTLRKLDRERYWECQECGTLLDAVGDSVRSSVPDGHHFVAYKLCPRGTQSLLKRLCSLIKRNRDDDDDQI